MLRILIIFFVLAIGLFVGPMLAGAQGIAFFQVMGYRVKMSFITFIIIELLFLLLLYIIYWFFKKLFYSKTTLGNWLRLKLPRKTAKKIEQAQFLLLEGDYKKAGKLLAKSAKAASNSTLTYLQAAQAQINNNKFIEARKSLDEAAKSCTNKEKFAFKLVQLRLQIKNNEYASAKNSVEALLTEKPHNPEVLRLANQLYYKTSDYQSIIDILPAMYKAEAFYETQLDQFKGSAYVGRIKQLAENEGVDSLIKWWKSQPRAIRNNVIYQKTIDTYQKKLIQQD